MITITPAQLATLLEETRTELVKALLLDRDSITLLSTAQASGLLDLHPRTMLSLGIPRVAIAPRVVKYRLCDILAFIESRLER